jgi:hypothetical protein
LREFSQAPSTPATNLRVFPQRQNTLAANLRVFPQAPNNPAAALRETINFYYYFPPINFDN